MLATIAQFKTRYGVVGSGEDALLTQILTGVSAQLARAAGRVYDGAGCLEKAARTVYLTPPYWRTRALWLPAWPVVSVTSVKEALLEDFDGADALTVNSDYQIDAGTGELRRVYAYWLQGWRAVQVVYTGGYTAAGDVPGDGETALPDDIVEAALQQGGFVWQRRASLGLTGESVQGGSVSAYAQDTLLPGVRETMGHYRRRLGI